MTMNGAKINIREWLWPVSRYYPVHSPIQIKETVIKQDNQHSIRYLLHESVQQYFCTSLLNTTSY
jgi:hypothetical protein